MASPAKSLTEEQRQQIIAALLAERRRRVAGQPHALQDDEQRTKRVQQLLAARAATRQHVHGVQQQRNVQLQENGLRQEHGHVRQEQSQDALLSPGSTCSLKSTRLTRDCARHKVQLAQQPASYIPVSLAPQQQPHHPAQHQSAVYQQLLHKAENGPVDISNLWEGSGPPSEQQSSLTLEEYGAGCCIPPEDCDEWQVHPMHPQLWHQDVEQQQPPLKQTLRLNQTGPTQQQQQRSRWQQDVQQNTMQQRHTAQQQPQQQTCKQLQQGRTARADKVRQQQQQQTHRLRSPAKQRVPLPPGYPATAEERLLQLSQPKSTVQHKYEQLKQEAESEVLQHCSFAPKTGRGPHHRLGHAELPAAERLYLTAAERQAKLERKAAEQQATHPEECTFKPLTNKASHEKYLAAYEYVPIHKRLGDVLRSRNEKLAQIQMQVEEENKDATFTPKINPRSSVLALRRSRQSLSPAPQDSSSPHRDQFDSSSRDKVLIRRSRSEADLCAQQQEYSFTPRINRSSKAMLQASAGIPDNFLQRQEYFDRLAREKKQLLQLAVEDQHCSFTPGASTSSLALGHSTSSVEDEGYLDRIERLAYQDSRRKEATRAALAEQLHHDECTFRPVINPRSQRIAQATPLQELYENSRGKMKRGAVAMEVQMQHEQECTFSPNLQKPGVPQSSPVEARLQLSATELDAVVKRLHNAKQSKEHKTEAVLSLKQYQELKQCTFAPEINKEVPRQQGPVLVRGLGRFMELKEMARRQAEQKAATEAKVFMTNIGSQAPSRPFTVPEPFRLGRTAESAAQEDARRVQVEHAAEQHKNSECTFKPKINSHVKTRRERVQKLLELTETAA